MSKRIGRLLRAQVCRLLLVGTFSVLPLSMLAQFNTDRLITVGRSALYYEDYVLSIQYFNQAITAKPYLYEPWFYRGVAKYYLDDLSGAEADCSKALDINPYVVGIYELRGLCRIRQDNFRGAISDYNKALRYDPENQSMWHNRVLCHIQDKDYDVALAQIDTMLTRWSRNAKVYAMQSEVYMLQKDTAKAITSLDKSLEIDPYDGTLWSQRAIISLSRRQWKDSEGFLSKAIHLMPKQVNNYVNRAIARFNQNNLRGTMADYDTAIDLDPNNFLAHYNRGLLRAQVGDDNRAILDFDFVLNLEPDNLMALFNRALLLENTGNLRGAIRDLTKIIKEFPNFWFGLQHRADCYRKLGMAKQAELDEFRILKAQMEKRLGRQPRLSKKQMRKRSDLDIEKYNQLTVDDVQEVEHEYQSDYRGRVQNRHVALEYLPMFAISLERPQTTIRKTAVFEANVEQYNVKNRNLKPLYVVQGNATLTEQETKAYFAYIDSLSVCIDRRGNTTQQGGALLLQRAVAYAVVQNDANAIDDLNAVLQNDTTCLMAYWQRAVCQSRINDFNAAQGTDIRMKTANVISDLSDALQLQENAYLYFNRGNVYVKRNDIMHAIDDYTKAIGLDANLAEAYFNRGLAYLAAKQQKEAIRDLSKAGELGIYTAYSIIKQAGKQ